MLHRRVKTKAQCLAMKGSSVEKDVLFVCHRDQGPLWGNMEVRLQIFPLFVRHPYSYIYIFWADILPIVKLMTFFLKAYSWQYMDSMMYGAICAWSHWCVIGMPLPVIS